MLVSFETITQVLHVVWISLNTGKCRFSRMEVAVKNIDGASALVKAIALGEEIPPLKGTVCSFVWEKLHKLIAVTESKKGKSCFSAQMKIPALYQYDYMFSIVPLYSLWSTFPLLMFKVFPEHNPHVAYFIGLMLSSLLVFN